MSVSIETKLSKGDSSYTNINKYFRITKNTTDISKLTTPIAFNINTKPNQ